MEVREACLSQTLERERSLEVGIGVTKGAMDNAPQSKKKKRIFSYYQGNTLYDAKPSPNNYSI